MMNNVYWMGGWARRWTDKRRNLPTDLVNEVSQDIEPSRGADGTKNRILFRGPAALERACRLGVDLPPLPRIQSSPGWPWGTVQHESYALSPISDAVYL